MFGKLAFVITLFAAASTAEAATFTWTADLDQAQELPAPVAVPGASGSAFGTVDSDTGLLDWNVSFGGLSGTPILAHFHAPGAVGVIAPVFIDILELSPNAPNSPLTGSTTIASSAVQNLLNGLFYINVHTELNPTGEIRGQVEAIPLPAALPLAILAFAMLGGLAARRRV